MTRALVPTNETDRLQALQLCGILDTPPEQSFDDLTSIAAQICGTPIALVSFIDADRQWFKAKVGLDITQTPRDFAFCVHTILQTGLFVVSDAQADERFSSNPLVTGPPHIRFYAGAPLITSEGYALGTVCVIDIIPRELSPLQLEALRALGRQVVAQLDLRRTTSEGRAAGAALRASEELKTRMIESSQDCFKTLDLEGRLLSMNAGGMQKLEICDFGAIQYSRWPDFWQDEDREAALAAVEAARNGGVGRFVGYCPTMTGKPKWWDVVVSPILDSDGQPGRLLALSRDVTEHKQAEDALRSIVDGTAAVTGGDFFASLVRHLASALQVRYGFVSECRDGKWVCGLAFWNGNGFVQNVEYAIAETPCENVIGGQICFYPEGVQELFPTDQDLVDLGVESYLGVPITNSAGQIIGHLAVLDDKPMKESRRAVSILNTFAARAGAELERVYAEQELHRALTELERLKNQLHAENIYLCEEIRHEHNFEEIVGSTPALLDALSKVEKVSPTDTTVLISGETGTGKELFARAIHNHSGRKDRPLVKVNCGAIAAGLVESELFGHVKGAFTGAIQNRVGRFELAAGGTIFLDEVGELPLDTQVKLLRVLQEREFEPLGSSRTVRVNVRVIAATNRDLHQAVREGRFRSDLFYRLNVVPIQVPPLREMRSDIPHLVMFFLDRFSKRFGKKINAVSRASMDFLTSYSWPGNVRELQNIIERAMVLSQGPVLTLDENLLPAAFGIEAAAAAHATAGGSQGPPPSIFPVAAPASTSVHSSLEDVDRRHVLAVLEQSRWVIEGLAGAARILNLHPNTLRSRMKKLGIQRPARDIS
jgi:PAS domain S-box-containing protein